MKIAVSLSFALLLFYSCLLSLFIQGWDTAELVAAGYHRLNPHPPGYPLYIWLQHSWTHLFPVSTVFWRAGADQIHLKIKPLGSLLQNVFICIVINTKELLWVYQRQFDLKKI